MRKLRFLLGAALIALAGASQAADRVTLLKPDRVWTGNSAAHSGWAVLVTDNRITAAGPATAQHWLLLT